MAFSNQLIVVLGAFFEAPAPPHFVVFGGSDRPERIRVVGAEHVRGTNLALALSDQEALLDLLAVLATVCGHRRGVVAVDPIRVEYDGLVLVHTGRNQ